MKRERHLGPDFSGLYRRGDIYVFRKAIPERLRSTIGKREFVQSLKTASRSEALDRYGQANAVFQNLISSAEQGVRPTVEAPDFRRLSVISERLGLSYLSADEVISEESLSIFMDRYKRWTAIGKPGGEQLQALFGEAKRDITLSELLERYIQDNRADHLNLNPRELKKKLNPKRLAIKELIDFAGTDRLSAFTKEVAEDFREHLTERICDGKIIHGTANKQLGHLRLLFGHAIERKLLNRENPFTGIRFKEKDNKRNAYSVGFVREVILAPGALDGLDPECRALIHAMIDTGAIASELCGLDPLTDICLNHPVPHIRIGPNQNRRLKTGSRPREIPLVGYARKAFEDFPGGFVSYCRSGGSEAASANCNEFMHRNGFIEEAMFRGGNEKPQTTYSFRHTFKDRLREHNVPDTMQDLLMGHKSPGMGSHYGEGYSLLKRLEYLKMIENDLDQF